MVNLNLKKDHPYYYQVQGQLGLTGLKWCDFVVFFQKGLIIQRIKFDELFWKSMIEKLTKFYQQHVILKAIEQQLQHRGSFGSSNIVL